MILSKIKEQENFIAAQFETIEKMFNYTTTTSSKILYHTPSSTQGKMNFHFCVALMILLCLNSSYFSVKIRPELQKNILKFGYGINYKYEGTLTHSFDRFYVVTKFILPTLDDLKLSPIGYDNDCKYF